MSQSVAAIKAEAEELRKYIYALEHIAAYNNDTVLYKQITIIKAHIIYV